MSTFDSSELEIAYKPNADAKIRPGSFSFIENIQEDRGDWTKPQPYTEEKASKFRDYDKLDYIARLRRKRVLTKEEQIVEHDKRVELNKILPAYSITRYPDQPIDTIDTEYWENMIDLNQFIETQFNNPDFKTTLSDPNTFQQFIFKCHDIAINGKNRDKYYGGVSNASLHEQNVGALREAPYIGSNVGRAKEYEYNDPEAMRFFKKTRTNNPSEKNALYEPYFRWVMTDPAESPPPSEIKDLQEGKSFNVFSTELSDRLSEEKKTVRGGYLVKDINDIKWFYHANPQDIPAILEQIREKYQELFSKNEVSKESALQQIHFAYRAGAICLPVLTVWNSINMSLTNNLLKKIGYKPISHGHLDTDAMILDSQISFKNFVDTVEATNHTRP